MIVVPKKKALVLRSRNPAQIMACLPHAKTITLRGQQLLAVPHELEVVRVLNNMGIRAPGPILHYYDWPLAKGQFPPMAHQKHTAEFLTLNPWCFVLSGMGTAKTMSALYAADWLMSMGYARKVLIVSPLSTLERVWADEIYLAFPRRTHAILHGTKEKRLKMLRQDVDFYIINHDGVTTIKDALLDRDDIDIVIIDELAVYRNSNTTRYKTLQKVIAGRAFCWGMTGSPTPNYPTDAYAQIKLISPARAPKYFGVFRDMTMKQKGAYKWVERPNAMDVVYNHMQPAIRYDRKDCIDLPPRMNSLRNVAMSVEQMKMYKDMVSRLKAEYAAGQITAVNESVKRMKLLQIACGVAYGQDGNHIIIPTPERLAVLEEIIEEAEGKVIVYVPLTGGLERIRDHLRKKLGDHAVEQVYGAVSERERSRIFSAFQQDKRLRVLVAHPKCMSHGLTLTEASVIVWYIPTDDNEVYEQANERITRPGQTRNQFVIGLEGSEVERRMYRRLQEKGKLQGLLLDMMKVVDI